MLKFVFECISKTAAIRTMDSFNSRDNERDMAIYCSGICHYPDERKSEQAHIPHAPTLLENAI